MQTRFSRPPDMRQKLVFRRFELHLKEMTLEAFVEA